MHIATTNMVVLVSPFEKESRKEALVILEGMRKAFPASAGWVEDWSHIEPVRRSGRTTYRAVRAHHKEA